jgi:hypothetical protein
MASRVAQEMGMVSKNNTMQQLPVQARNLQAKTREII